HQRQMRFCHDYSGLARATVPKKLDLGTPREAKSAHSTGTPAILTGTGNTKRTQKLRSSGYLPDAQLGESRRTVAKKSYYCMRFFLSLRRQHRFGGRLRKKAPIA